MLTASNWFCHFSLKLIIFTNLQKPDIAWIFQNQAMGVSVPVKVNGVLRLLYGKSSLSVLMYLLFYLFFSAITEE